MPKDPVSAYVLFSILMHEGDASTWMSPGVAPPFFSLHYSLAAGPRDRVALTMSREAIAQAELLYSKWRRGQPLPIKHEGS